MSAKRLPGKPLLKIKGKSIIVHVLNKAKKCGIGRVVVATEDIEIAKEVKKNKGLAILTSKKHKSGTDRIWEAYKKIKNNKIKYIINLQGDEPLIDIKDIQNLNKIVKNQNIVKVETKNKISKNRPQEAKNFTRIPNKKHENFYQHIGIYHYNVNMLKKFFNLKRTKNEIKNKLEQLRALDNKIPINVILAKKNVLGVDTKEDFIELKKILEYKK